MSLIRATIFLRKRLKQQRSFIKRTVAIDIAEAKKTNDDSLEERDFVKISNYYALAVPAVLGEAFSVLLGKSMTDKERMSMTHLGGMSGLFDDFFDKTGTSKKRIIELIEDSEGIEIQKSNEKLFLQFYRKGLESCANAVVVKDNLHKVYEAQVLSERQILTDINQEEIDRITLEKGGISFIFYRSTMDSKMTVEEEELIYNLGGLLQLENDIFDIYKDYQEGIKTLATTATKMDELRQYYSSFLDQVIANVLKTSYPKNNKKKFVDIILLILCRGFTCLDILEQNERRTNNIFSIKDYSRKDLICDMEKPSNILRTVNYLAKYDVDYG